MLTIKAPISLNCTKQMLTAGEDFSQKILGNYELFSTDIDAEDFIHLLSQPAEVFLAEGESSLGFFTNTEITNTNIQKATIINNMFNRLLLKEQVDLTYQDRVYITGVLQKLGIHNTIEFMNEVNKYRLEQNDLSNRLTDYWEQSEYLAELVEEYTSNDTYRNENTSTTEIERNSYLHQEIFERLKTAALYQIVNNFVTRELGVDRISSTELMLSEQKFFSEKMLITSIENLVRDDKVPLYYHTDNIFEEEAALPGSDEGEVRQNITNALLFDTIRNVLESRREERNIYNKSWYQVVENLYQSADNSLQRIQLFIRQNLERISYNRSYENAVLYERMQELVTNRSGDNTTTNAEYRTVNNYEGDNVSIQQDLYHAEYGDEGDVESITDISNNEINTLSRESIETVIREGEKPDIPEAETPQVYENLIEQTNNLLRENTTEVSESSVVNNFIFGDNISQTELYHSETTEEISESDSHDVSEGDVTNVTEKNLTNVSGDVTTENINEIKNYLNNQIDRSESILNDNSKMFSESLAINEQAIDELHLQSDRYHTDVTNEITEYGSQLIDEADIYNITEDSLTNISEEVTEENTKEIKRLLTRQIENNRTENEFYLNQLTAQYESRKPKRTKQERIDAQRMALESPEEFMREFREENQRQQELRENYEAQRRMLTPPEEMNIYEIIENYLENPENVPEGVTISRNNIGSLLQDSMQVEKSVEKQERIIKELKEQTPQKAIEAVERKMSHPEFSGNGETYANRQVTHANIVHREQRSEIDEEFLDEILRRQQTTNNREVVEHNTVNNTNVIQETQINELVSKQLEEQNRRIEDMIEGGMNRRVGTISDAVYRQIEKRLTNERRRRGI